VYASISARLASRALGVLRLVCEPTEAANTHRTAARGLAGVQMILDVLVVASALMILLAP
jgi:hypothetical protein